MQQDLRYALRGLRRSPGFTLAAVLSLAAGIGFNSAVFTVVRADLLHTRGVRGAEAVLSFVSIGPAGDRDGGLLAREFRDYRAALTSFQQVTARRFARFSLSRPGEPPRYVVADLVSANYFSVMGVTPLLGRDFRAGEDQAGSDDVVILPYPLWQSQFGGDPKVIGRTVLLTGRPVTVIGVLPESWLGGFRRVYLPLVLDTVAPDQRDLSVNGRLKDGVPAATAKAEVATLAGRIEREHPETNSGWTMDLTPEVPTLGVRMRDDRSRILVMLFAAVGFVLLIACLNIAGLLLARATVRRREIAMRRALGATRLRIVRQWFTESLVLAALAGVPGLLIALYGGPVIAGLWNVTLPSGADPLVILFTSAAALGSAFFFGLVPAWQASGNQAIALHTGREAPAGGTGLRSVLVVGEIAIALLLLSGAGLAVRSFQALVRIDPGFETHHLLAFRYQFVDGRDPGRKAAYFRQTIEQVTALPGVRAAAWAGAAPVYNTPDRCRIRFEGDAPFEPGSKQPEVYYRRVTAGYVETMGLPLLAGRSFRAADDRRVIINQPLARKYFAGRNPIGQRISLDAGSRDWREVVGVVQAISGEDLREMLEPSPEVIESVSVPSDGPWLLVRTAAPSASLVPAIRKTMGTIDPNTPEANFATLDQTLDRITAPQRSSAGLLSLFAALALSLAVVGIYGVMSYFVVQRSQEVGIRMALGARPGDILQLVLGHSARLAAIGVAIGLGLSLSLERVVSIILFGGQSGGIATFAPACLVLLLVTLAAGAIPARRAARLDPMKTLRQ